MDKQLRELFQWRQEVAKTHKGNDSLRSDQPFLARCFPSNGMFLARVSLKSQTSNTVSFGPYESSEQCEHEVGLFTRSIVARNVSTHEELKVLRDSFLSKRRVRAAKRTLQDAV